MDDGRFLEIFRRLLARYGPQHWWPAGEPFEVIVGAILTQSTSWRNVEKAMAGLRAAGALSPGAIRRLPIDSLARLVYPCGYYNVKATRLKAFADFLGGEFGDSLDRLFALDAGELRGRLLAVKGIGEETADSIILYAGGKPVFVVDAYTRRIAGRIGLAGGARSYREYQSLFERWLPLDTRLFNEYHALIVRLGKEACRRQPVCPGCCLQDLCRHGHDCQGVAKPCPPPDRGTA